MRSVLRFASCALAACVSLQAACFADDEAETAKADATPDAVKQQVEQAAKQLKLHKEQIQQQLEALQVQEKELAAQRVQFDQQRQLFEKQKIDLAEKHARSLAEAAKALAAQRFGAADAEAAGQREKAEQAVRAAKVYEQQLKWAPLPDNAVLRAFKLQYVRPEEIGQALHNIAGGAGPRVAVDERTNALIIAGNDRQMSVAEQLVKTLDQPGKAQGNAGPETLQVRIVWLLDNLNDRSPERPKSTIVSPQVIDVLHELGFEHPTVVSQQLSTITLDTSGHDGNFFFHAPTLVKGSPWRFEAKGEVNSTADNRYSLNFTIDVDPPGNPQQSQMGGSIVTPLGHYTVLGTTTFVGPEVKEGEVGAQAEHLSAFVVYLDRAKEFPGDSSAEKSEEKERKGENR